MPIADARDVDLCNTDHRVSDVERRQLGTVRLKRNGEPSTRPYPTAEQWPAIRQMLLDASRRSNPRLNDTLTAYTPGETVGLLDHPEISAWHGRCAQRIDDRYATIVFVPCAKTKPWTGPAVRRSKLYSAYNQLREEMPDVCFVTISEPLGIVPMDRWNDFPQYDNPGLFKDDAQRTSMTTKQWEASPFGRCYGLPFDDDAYRECIDRLGTVVGAFIDANHGTRMISFVDDVTGVPTTHGEMLDVAVAQTTADVICHPKRLQPRISPLDYLRDQIDAHRVQPVR